MQETESSRKPASDVIHSVVHLFGIRSATAKY